MSADFPDGRRVMWIDPVREAGDETQILAALVSEKSGTGVRDSATENRPPMAPNQSNLATEDRQG